MAGSSGMDFLGLVLRFGVIAEEACGVQRGDPLRAIATGVVIFKHSRDRDSLLLAFLEEHSVTVERGRTKQTGTIRKGIEMGFEIEGTLGVTPMGESRLHQASQRLSSHLRVDVRRAPR